MSGTKEIIKYLRNVGTDFDGDGETVDTSPECEGQGEKDEDSFGYCPDHENCGICRFEYMNKKGWLNKAENKPFSVGTGGDS